MKQIFLEILGSSQNKPCIPNTDDSTLHEILHRNYYDPHLSQESKTKTTR